MLRRRDVDFLLFDVFRLESVLEASRFAAYDRTAIEGVLDVAERLARDAFAPHAAKGDIEEPHLDNGRVRTIPEAKTALDAYRDAGLFGATFKAEDGGLELPFLAAQAMQSFFYAANVSTTAYPMLTIGAAHLLAAHGTAEQKRRFMAPMVEGRFFGTMCLSEPQAGSSLGDIRTRAEPQADGTYRITGNKMWISGADHEMAENIVHLVLAKIPGGPPGTKGISLFIVPKFLLDADGQPGERNDVRVAGLNHKMGYRGTVNAALNFGENGACIGYLVGNPHEGLMQMFHMMNEARIGVGCGAAALALAGFTHSLRYAEERTQGRPLTDKDPASPPVPITAHADVRRMLLAQKALGEGALALCLYCARLVDQITLAESRAEKTRLTGLLDLLTPLAKTWPSEYGLVANAHAIQILGGYGYTRDFPLERIYRDNRLNPIHEGTTGIQGLDLLGRKVMRDRGETLAELGRLIAETAARARSVAALAPHADELQAAMTEVGRVTGVLMGAAAKGEIDTAFANATHYLLMLGHVVVAWLWLETALAAAAARAEGGADSAFLDGKIAACRYFFTYELPEAHMRAGLLARLDRTTIDLDPAVL